MNKLSVAVVGSGVSGIGAAWLLSKTCNVTLFEADQRCGGHACTENFQGVPVDVGFIVYNEQTYPNLTAFFHHLGVKTAETEMGFSVSLDNGRHEYSGGSLGQLLGTPRGAVSRSHWSMLSDLARFYRSAKSLARDLGEDVSLGAFLETHKFGKAFIDRHLIPMASAIWSSRPEQMFGYPAKAFVEFFDNHQLLSFGKRDKWRTVSGGSHNYVQKAIAQGIDVRTGEAVMQVRRGAGQNTVVCKSGLTQEFDHVVLATHADQALALLEAASIEEAALLSPFQYSNNEVVVHRDEKLMPTRRRHWSSWNYVGASGSPNCGVTYWMNSLQHLSGKTQYFVTLNPALQPREALTEMRLKCRHPVFTTDTLKAQRQLWRLQGQQNTWFCGAYFGAGFHEDGLQAGLAVAEQLGGLARPWHVANASGRIHLGAAPEKLAVVT